MFGCGLPCTSSEQSLIIIVCPSFRRVYTVNFCTAGQGGGLAIALDSYVNDATVMISNTTLSANAADYGMGT